MSNVANFIGGELVDSVTGATMALVDPSTGEEYARAPISSEADIDNAYAAAATAFADWKRTVTELARCPNVTMKLGGMMMRLAFSVAVSIDPDILLVDEVLAVGDRSFQEKCFNKVMEFRERGKTILCVSHAAGMVQHLCSRAIW